MDFHALRSAVLLVIGLTAFAAPSGARAGTISLTEPERAKLATLVASDTEAATQFTDLRKQADAALSAEPDPIHHILSEGRLKNDPDKIRTGQSMRDMAKLHALGYAFAVTGDAKYAAKARGFLTAWAEVNESRGDPIDDTSLDTPIICYDLVRSTCGNADRQAIEKWLRQVAEAEVRSAHDRPSSTKNNWQSHRLKIVGLVGLLLDDRKLIDWAIAAYKEHVDHALNADGSSLDFYQRDALHYHCYDLEPLITLAIAARQHGGVKDDLYTYTGAKGGSVAKSVRFLIPYCDGSKTHAEFVNSKVAFDRKRAESGDARYKAGTPFDPKLGVQTLELAAYFEPSFVELICKIEGGKAKRYPTWQTVVEEVMR